MRIAIPASGSPVLKKVVHGHLSSAPVFAIYDTETGELTETPNPRLGKDEGVSSPLGVVKALLVDAVICAGIGRWAIKMIEASGTKVFIAHGGLVSDAIEDYRNGKLRRANESDTIFSQ